VSRIDLNADAGEGFEDEGLALFVTSFSIACGGHAGDERTMRDTLRLAGSSGLAAGAHPSFPDRARFGRVELPAEPAEIEAFVARQVATLFRLGREEDVPIAHVKPHGALYHAAARDSEIAAAVARAVRQVDAGLAVTCAPGSALLSAAREAGLATLVEGFADRAYQADGTLVPRDRPGALLTDPATAARQAVALATRGDLDTLCLHSDTPGAALLARAVRDALLAAGVDLRPPGRPA
jgi:UPF0271 protein